MPLQNPNSNDLTRNSIVEFEKLEEECNNKCQTKKGDINL